MIPLSWVIPMLSSVSGFPNWRMQHLSKNRHILLSGEDTLSDAGEPTGAAAPSFDITDETLLEMYKGTDMSDRDGVTDYGDVINDHRKGWDLWPSGGNNLLYVFDSNVGSCERSTVSVALDVIQSANSNIQFSELDQATFFSSGGSLPAIHVTSATRAGCFASLGYRSNSENVVNIGSGCVNVGTVIHLFMHALGVFHEHQRPDRDKYVEVVSSNIDQARMGGNLGSTKFESVFSPSPLSVSEWAKAVSQLDYDYGSIMHNGRCHYSVDEPLGADCVNRPTLSTTASSIGNRGTLSARDVQLLNILYPRSADVGGENLPVPELADAITGETTLCTVADSNAFEWSSDRSTVAPKTTSPPSSSNNPIELAMFSNFFSDPAHKTTIIIVASAVGGFFVLMMAGIAFLLYFSKTSAVKRNTTAPLLGRQNDEENDYSSASSTDSELYADLLEDRPPPALASSTSSSEPPPVPPPSAIV